MDGDNEQQKALEEQRRQAAQRAADALQARRNKPAQLFIPKTTRKPAAPKIPVPAPFPAPAPAPAAVPATFPAAMPAASRDDYVYDDEQKRKSSSLTLSSV